MAKWKVENFYGFANKPDPADLKDGVVTGGYNWSFAGTKIIKGEGTGKVELRRGYKRLGSNAGVGKVTGLRVGKKNDGTEILFRTRARKIEYYDTTTEDWIEVGTNSLPSDANGEDVAIAPYTSLAGSAIYFSSRNSSIYKIMLANPGTLIDLLLTNFRGKIKIKNNRIILWDRYGSNRQQDITGVYGSHIDKDSYTDYTAVTAESIGSAGSINYTGTLAFKAAGSKRSCFGVKITDGTQNLYDDFNGSFIGDGTGTINYASGAYNVTFNSTTSGAVTSNYYWEDPTSNGIADFTAPSNPRVAGESFIVRQDDGGGKMQNVGLYNSVIYCLHEKKGWKLTISADDTTAANLPYRDQIGIPNWQAMDETEEGIFFVDDSSGSSDQLAIKYLTLQQISTEVIPVNVSDLLDLSGYRFDTAVVKSWGDYIVVACRTSDATENNRLLVYDKKFKMWQPPHDLQAYVLEVYNGALETGDSTTNNVYEVYSGFDDDGSEIPNEITFNISKCGIGGLKRLRKFYTEGEIQPDQTLEVYASYDRGDFVLIDTIAGNGSYVDIGNDIAIGQTTLGLKEVGSGTIATANHYKKETTINSDKFRQIQLKFTATGVGYVSITAFGSNDIREKGVKELTKYVS
jgi:hypothetical protein